MKVVTLVQWRDPQDIWHEVGEIADITVSDLEDLIKSGTVEPAPADPEPVVAPKGASRKQSAPEVEVDNGN